MVSQSAMKPSEWSRRTRLRRMAGVPGFVSLGFCILMVLAGGCVRSVCLDAPATMHLISPAFKDGANLPAQYTCGGAGVSPPLTWTKPPAGTKSFAVTCLDPDAPGGTFTHWLVWDVRPAANSLAEGAVPTGARQGKNDFGNVGYGAPCPPAGAPHHYVFTVYALNETPDVAQGGSRDDLFTAIQGHILAKGQITGLYGRS